ncbi:MAG TPA: hypothetical protein VK717_01305 [Opitutaceae bacterium]|jgi:hypothetical protein|nr:hypothetical protein [Opitutaceae bacterium]
MSALRDHEEQRSCDSEKKKEAHDMMMSVDSSIGNGAMAPFYPACFAGEFGRNALVFIGAGQDPPWRVRAVGRAPV